MDGKAMAKVITRNRFSPARWFGLIPTALVLIAASGCTLYVTSTAKWVGHPREELTREWGEGLDTASGAGDGSTILQYVDMSLIVTGAPLTGGSKEIVTKFGAQTVSAADVRDRFPPVLVASPPSGNFFWPCVTWFVVDPSGIIREAHVEPVTTERSVDACVWPKFAGAQVTSRDRSSPQGVARH